MAAGDRTKKIISEIRTLLNDEERKIIPTNGIIIVKLREYQAKFMEDEKTSKRTFTVELEPEVYSYHIHPSVFSVTKTSVEAVAVQAREANPKIKDLIFSEDDFTFADGDEFIYEGYIKPIRSDIEIDDVEYASNDIMYDPDIAAVRDPIIEEDYDHLLVKAVLSEYKKNNEEFWSLEKVMEAVKKKSAELASYNRYKPTGSFNKVKF